MHVYLYAEIDKEAARRARRSLDVCGHYSVPELIAAAKANPGKITVASAGTG